MLGQTSESSWYIYSFLTINYCYWMTAIITCRMLSFNLQISSGASVGTLGKKSENGVKVYRARLLTLMRNVAKATDEESYNKALRNLRKRFMDAQ